MKDDFSDKYFCATVVITNLILKQFTSIKKNTGP